MEAVTQIMLADYEREARPKVSNSNFLYSFSFLPKEERSAIHSIYNFFSYIDNIVDDEPTTDEKIINRKLSRLAFWEREINRLYDFKENTKFLAPLMNAIDRFVIPRQYFLTLIDGCKSDLYKTRYQNFEELKEYCYSVASIVGLTCIEIFGYKYEETKNYAINLGYALQLTNILRDVKTDKDRGYIYLPKEDMDKFGYTEEDLMNEVYNDNFRELMSYEARRAREFYHLARSSMHPNERKTLIAAEIMDDIYFRILEKIELNDYNVFEKKIRVSNAHKVIMALKQWLSIKLFVKPISE